MKYLMKIQLIGYILLLLPVLISCHAKNKADTEIVKIEPDSSINIDIDHLKTEPQIYFSSVFKGMKLIPLETNEKCLIGNVSQIMVYKDTLYVLDTFTAKALFLFDLDGKFIQKIGAVGKGAGEFIMPSMFAINEKNNEINILDHGQRKVIVFSSKGAYVHEFKLKANYGSSQIAIQNEHIYLEQLARKEGIDDFLLYAIDERGEIKDKIFPFQKYGKGFKQPVGYSNSLFKTKDDIKYMRPFSDTIFSLKDNGVSPYITITTKNEITKQEIRKMNSFQDLNEFLMYLATQCDKFLGIRNYMENTDLVMFQYKNNHKPYYLFYWPKHEEVLCTTSLINDLTNSSDPTRFFTTYKNQFVSCVENNLPGEIETFITNIKNKKNKLPKEELLKLGKINENSNPVLVFYECMEGPKVKE